jgi:hypothetical protein
LFGGSTGGFTPVLLGTWLWDGQNWQQQTPAMSPSPRTGAMVAFDGGHVVVFGGFDGVGGIYDDMWQWDGSSWHDITPATRPGARGNAEVAFDPVLHAAVLTGGEDLSSNVSDTWTWSGSSWTPRTGTQPSARQRSAAAFDPHGSHVVLYGGDGLGGRLGDTYYFDSPNWTQVTPPPESSYQGPTYYALAYDPLHGVVVLQGGDAITTIVNHTTENDTRVWKGGQWLIVGNGPKVTRSAMSYDTARRELVHFGGGTVSGSLGFVLPVDTTSTWDGSSWTTKSPATSPSARYNHSMAYDSFRQRVVLFGGNDGFTGPFDDLWEWDGANWTQVMTATGPSAREGAALAYDQARHRLVLFGGQDGDAGHALGDTWEYDGTAWTQIMPASSPPARGFAGMAYEIERRRIVLFGGHDLSQTQAQGFGDTWEWDGTKWTRRLVAVAPSPRSCFTLAYDALHARVIEYGGIDSINNVLADTYSYGFTSTAVPRDGCDELDSDGDGLIGCADPDCWSRCDPLCPPGGFVACDADRPRCGDGVCNHDLEDYRLCPSDCAR